MLLLPPHKKKQQHHHRHNGHHYHFDVVACHQCGGAVAASVDVLLLMLLLIFMSWLSPPPPPFSKNCMPLSVTPSAIPVFVSSGSTEHRKGLWPLIFIAFKLHITAVLIPQYQPLHLLLPCHHTLQRPLSALAVASPAAAAAIVPRFCCRTLPASDEERHRRIMA